MDASLETSQSYSNLAGEDRKNDATGNTADTNVVWLTKSNAKERAGSVKVVTLDDGSYCVLWEKLVKKDDSKGRWSFDSLRYVILDERGNVLRKETTVYNARLSDTYVQPMVNGKTTVNLTKLNGKKLKLKKNFKVCVKAYQMVNGKKVSLANTITGYVAGRKNTKYTNAKKIKLSKSKYGIKAKKRAEP